MIKILIKWVVFAIIIMLSAYYVPDIKVENFWSACLVVAAFVLANVLLKPILVLLTMPINLMTLGLFSLVINLILFVLVAYFVPGITLTGFLGAIIGSLVVSITSAILSKI